MSKTIFRVEKSADNPFVMIDKRPIENPALSWKAKGVLTYLLSRPDNWVVQLGDLIKRSPDGDYAVRQAIRELKAAGHITQTTERDEQGHIKRWMMNVHEVPLLRDYQQVGNRALNKNKGTLGRTPRNKGSRKPNKKEDALRATDFPEVVLYREVTDLYPPKEVFSSVVQSVQKVQARLGREVTKDDLKPFRLAWVSKGYNRFAITWLEWAESGQIPQNGKPASNVNAGISQFLARHNGNPS